MKFPLIPIALTAALPLSAADTPAQVFQIQCAACHAVDQMGVGPSLVEIAGIYRDRPDEFVKWCVAPQPKREGVIEMPSMAHLGEPVLRQLHGYVIAAAAGKTELKKGKGDPYAVPAAMTRRPQVQRIFLPEASPAAIAVALPGDLSFCFDAAECRLRYVWKGGFLDGAPYWRTNGSSLAKLDGPVVYRDPDHPLTTGTDDPLAAPEFLGYRIEKDGVPTFRYRRGGVTFAETILPLPDGKGIARSFATDGKVPLAVTIGGEAAIASSTGSFAITAEQSKSFTLTFRWK
jgi:cytochrome c551/c552